MCYIGTFFSNVAADVIMLTSHLQLRAAGGGGTGGGAQRTAGAAAFAACQRGDGHEPAVRHPSWCVRIVRPRDVHGAHHEEPIVNLNVLIVRDRRGFQLSSIRVLLSKGFQQLPPRHPLSSSDQRLAVSYVLHPLPLS